MKKKRQKIEGNFSGPLVTAYTWKRLARYVMLKTTMMGIVVPNIHGIMKMLSFGKH